MLLKALDLKIQTQSFLYNHSKVSDRCGGGHGASNSRDDMKGRGDSPDEAAALPLYRQMASPREACAPREEPRGGALESQRLGEFSHANSGQRQLQAGELERSYFHRSIDPSVAS